MIYRDKGSGKILFESFDEMATILSDRLPKWLRAPELPAILRPNVPSMRHRDPETLDLFTGEPKP